MQEIGMRNCSSQKKQVCIFLVSVSMIMGIGIYHSMCIPGLGAKDDEIGLKKILEETANYCEKVKGMALFYVCKEKITEKEFFYSGTTFARSATEREQRPFRLASTKEKKLLYDYQLIKKEGELKEQRILLEEDGKKMFQEDAELDRIKYVSENLVFGPVGFLSKSWQGYFNYEIVGEDSVGGTKTITIRSSPKEEMEENYNFGKIWIDKDSFQILKIEWEPVSIKHYEKGKIPTFLGEFKQRVIWTVDYGVEKNGVRFPSCQMVKEIFINERSYKILKRELSCNYLDYKFFTVETEVKYD
jgi:hypothetical protein